MSEENKENQFTMGMNASQFEALLSIARREVQTQKWEDAEDTLEVGLLISPQNKELLLLLAKTKRALGREFQANMYEQMAKEL